MSVLIDNQAVIAFKKLLGKTNTDVSKALGNESLSAVFYIHKTSVWISNIDSNPTIAEGLGAVLEVTADLVLDESSNNHAYQAVWPNPLPAGTPAGITSGDPIIGCVPPAYGIGYEVTPYVGGTPISLGDPRDWVFQYDSGVFWQQDNVGGTPTTIDLYVYTGYTLADDDCGGGGSGEWQSSVISVLDDPPGTPEESDRYLIGTGTGVWSGNDDKIAQFNGASWEYIDPTNGMSVKVDDEDNYLYHYEGDYPSGSWIKSPLGQIRVAGATGTNTYTVTVSPSVSLSDDIVYFITFANDNTGASTIDINSLGAENIHKYDDGSLVDLEAGDIQSGIIYMLQYTGSEFQIFIGGGGSKPRNVDDSYSNLGASPTITFDEDVSHKQIGHIETKTLDQNSNVTIAGGSQFFWSELFIKAEGNNHVLTFDNIEWLNGVAPVVDDSVARQHYFKFRLDNDGTTYIGWYELDERS